MRARYSAYALGDIDYLLSSWHPSTRPPSLQWDPDLRWFRLDVLGTTRGGMLDTVGTVEFAAHYRLDGGAGVQRENSRFVREDGLWFYVDAG